MKNIHEPKILLLKIPRKKAIKSFSWAQSFSLLRARRLSPPIGTRHSRRAPLERRRRDRRSARQRRRSSPTESRQGSARSALLERRRRDRRSARQRRRRVCYRSSDVLFFLITITRNPKISRSERHRIRFRASSNVLGAVTSRDARTPSSRSELERSRAGRQVRAARRVL